MQRLIQLIILSASWAVHADTIDHYMNIANNIPKMEMKADPQAQAWARSARNILVLTSESVTESLLLANATASSQGMPLFCLPQGVDLNAQVVDTLIRQTYQNLSSQDSDKNKMTVSQIALMGLRSQYPCSKHPQYRVAIKKPSPASQWIRTLRP